MQPIDALSAARFAADKLVKHNLFDSPRMFLDVYGLEPGQAQKPHRHDDQDKVYFALDGESVVTIGDREFPLRRGEVAVCPAGQDHGVANRGSQRVTLLVMMTKVVRGPT